MSIRSLSDVIAAYDAGRVHVQRFTKNALSSIDNNWNDWAFTGGQPAFDARIGVANQFNPYIASRNDAIWFPGINVGQERYLAQTTLRMSATNVGQVTAEALIYDLLGVYPLIDGDSTDVQEFNNTLTLPRYTSGVGVLAILVNHVAPVLNVATANIIYEDQTGVDKLVNTGIAFTGLGRSVVVGTVAGVTTSLSVPFANGSQGVKAVKSLQFLTPPGGLFSLYLYKALTNIQNSDGVGVTERIPSEKPFLQTNAWAIPRIYDGAHLGMFVRHTGGNRSIGSMFGNMEFIWG